MLLPLLRSTTHTNTYDTYSILSITAGSGLDSPIPYSFRAWALLVYLNYWWVPSFLSFFLSLSFSSLPSSTGWPLETSITIPCCFYTYLSPLDPQVSDHGHLYTVYNDPYGLLSIQHGPRSLRYHRGEEAWRTTTAAQINLSPFVIPWMFSSTTRCTHTSLLSLYCVVKRTQKFLYGFFFSFFYHGAYGCVSSTSPCAIVDSPSDFSVSCSCVRFPYLGSKLTNRIVLFGFVFIFPPL